MAINDYILDYVYWADSKNNCWLSWNVWELSVHVFMCVHSVLESVEGIILSSELLTLI